jgi:hypothetical protein
MPKENAETKVFADSVNGADLLKGDEAPKSGD